VRKCGWFTKCPVVKGAMTEVTPFLDERGTLEADMRNNRLLREITDGSCTMWVVGPKTRMN
jgi:hypothetical protein